MIQDEFDQYIKKVYPTSIPPFQRKELALAFAAGAAITLRDMMDVSSEDIGEDEAVIKLQKMHEDTIHFALTANK